MLSISAVRKTIYPSCQTQWTPPQTHLPISPRQVESSRVFFFDEVDSTGFDVRCGGIEHCRADYRIDRESFPWFLLEFVHGGRGSLFLDGQETALKPGVFFLYGPGMPHHIATDLDRPLVKYFTGFSGPAAASFLEQHDLRPGMVSQCLKADPIRRAFDNLVERGSRNSKYSRPLCTAIVQQLLLMCREDAVDADSTDTRAFATFSRVKAHIEQDYLTLGSLEAIATGCELDAPYICRLFARFHDESPYQFLTRLRMQHAATLLLEEGATVKEAARATGFPDPLPLFPASSSPFIASRPRASARRSTPNSPADPTPTDCHVSR